MRTTIIAVAATLAATAAHASSDAAIAGLDRATARACRSVSGLRDARVDSAVRFSDAFGIDARIVRGTWPQPAHEEREGDDALPLRSPGPQGGDAGTADPVRQRPPAPVWSGRPSRAIPRTVRLRVGRCLRIADRRHAGEAEQHAHVGRAVAENVVVGAALIAVAPVAVEGLLVLVIGRGSARRLRRARRVEVGIEVPLPAVLADVDGKRARELGAETDVPIRP